MTGRPSCVGRTGMLVSLQCVDPSSLGIEPDHTGIKVLKRNVSVSDLVHYSGVRDVLIIAILSYQRGVSGLSCF
jgi:hypothetical protein